MGWEAEIHQVALAMLARRALSVRELGERLDRKGFAPAAVAVEVARLRSAGLVDDLELARAVCRTQRERGYGPRALRAVLRRRGLLKVAREHALAELGDEDETGALALALARATRKYPQYRRLLQARQKVIRYLLTRGFGGAAVRRALAAAPGDEADVGEAFEQVDPPDVP